MEKFNDQAESVTQRKKEEKKSCTKGIRIINPVLKGPDHGSAPATENIKGTYLVEQGRMRIMPRRCKLLVNIQISRRVADGTPLVHNKAQCISILIANVPVLPVFCCGIAFY